MNTAGFSPCGSQCGHMKAGLCSWFGTALELAETVLKRQQDRFEVLLFSSVDLAVLSASFGEMSLV